LIIKIYPVSGITALDVDLDALRFDCETVGRFRAHYITCGVDKTGFDAHFSAPVDFTAICPCEWTGKTARADGNLCVAQGKWAAYAQRRRQHGEVVSRPDNGSRCCPLLGRR